MVYNVYSLPENRTVIYHPDVGTANLHQCSHGKMTIIAGCAGDPDDYGALREADHRNLQYLPAAANGLKSFTFLING